MSVGNPIDGALCPPAVIRRLHEETAKALQVPEVKERLAKTATAPMPMSTEQFTKYFHDDVASTLKLAKDAVLKVIPNDSRKYAVLSISDVSNVTVVGGTLEGDRT